MTEQDAIDQQRRVIIAAKTEVGTLLASLERLAGHLSTYTRLGLGDDQFTEDAAFEGTGVGKAEYRSAVTSIDAIMTLLAAGHGTNLERFAR